MSVGFKFNGTDLTSTYGVYLVTGYRRPMMPGTDDSFQRIPGKAGVYDFGCNVKERRLSLDCVISGESREGLLGNIDTLVALLDPTKGLSQLIFNDQDDRYFMARFIGDFDMVLDGVKQGSFILNFVCPDPYGFAVEETDSEVTINESPEAFQETPGGNVLTHPIWEITLAASVTAITVKNSTRGETLGWTIAAGSSDVLKIDTTNMWCYKNDVLDMIGVTGQFPLLNGGSVNNLEISGISAATLHLMYRARFL